MHNYYSYNYAGHTLFTANVLLMRKSCSVNYVYCCMLFRNVIQL